jgi:hypothetical protein
VHPSPAQLPSSTTGNSPSRCCYSPHPHVGVVVILAAICFIGRLVRRLRLLVLVTLRILRVFSLVLRVVLRRLLTAIGAAVFGLDAGKVKAARALHGNSSSVTHSSSGY